MICVHVADHLPSVDPVRPAERIETLDVLRGWAVFGMLVVNMVYFSTEALGRPTGVDAVSAALIQILAADKFWTLFSILFGYGFALQMERAAARGAPFVGLYTRRLLVLMVLGLAHILLHPLEILHRYALVGFLLIPLRRASATALVVVAVVAVTLPAVGPGLDAVRTAGRPAGSESAAPPASGDAEPERLQSEAVTVYSDGTLLELMAYNARRFTEVGADIRVVRPLPYFLLGLYLGRRRWLQDIGRRLPQVRRARWWTLGLGIALPVLVVAVMFVPSDLVRSVVTAALPETLALSGGLIGLFYASTIVLLGERPGWRNRLGRFAAVGRLALTNYLLQTVLVTTILYGYGLGLYGRVGAAAGLPMTLAIFMGQVWLSRWWLRRFRMGPVEWLWRSASYGRPQPMLVSGS